MVLLLSSLKGEAKIFFELTHLEDVTFEIKSIIQPL